MAGYLRLALGVVLGTTTLGTVGGGGYYVATHGMPTSLASADNSANTADAAEATSAQPADLDAVASAWAQPASAASGETAQPAADISRTERSASAALARAEEAAAASSSSDRYGIYPSMLAAPATETAAPAGAQPEPTTAPQAAEPQSVEPLKPEEPANTAKPQSVARGQEPNDESSAAQNTAAAKQTADSAAAKAFSANDAFSEPQPLKLPAGEPSRSIASERARDAFRAQSATSAAGDRYGVTSAPAAKPANQNQKAAAESATVNPFAANAAGAPADAASEGLIQTLPVASGAAPLNSTAQQPADGGYGAANDRTARATLGAGSEPYGAAQAAPTGPAPNSLEGNSAFSRETQGLSAGGASSYGNDHQEATLEGTGKPGERALEGPQNPALTIQKFAPGEIQVGKAAKFVIQVRNVGNQVANEVEIRDEVPQGARLVSTAPNAQPNGNQVVWQLGKLSAGEERTLEMQLMPVSEGEIGSVATVTYTGQASVKTRCTMPQLAIRMTAAEKVMIGQEQRVKIELKNPGTGDATGVMLFENVPSNVKHAAGPALEFEIGTLRAGETRELELVLVAEKAGKVINALSARADGNLQVQQQVQFEVIAPALEVAVNGPERRYLERPATYEVSVENPGTAPARDVQLITKLPKGLRFVKANNMGEYDAASHAVYWSLAELPEGESGKVELVAMPVETGTQMLEVEGRASQGLTDQTTRQIVVEGLAAIMFEVRDLDDPIEVGGETGYEVRIVNQGTKAATNVRVAINLPPGMKVLSAEGETQYAVQGGTLVFEPLGQLAPKADTVYRVRVQGVQAGDQRISVEVNTDDLGQPIRREESTRVFGDE